MNSVSWWQSNELDFEWLVGFGQREDVSLFPDKILLHVAGFAISFSVVVSKPTVYIIFPIDLSNLCLPESYD